MIYGSIYHEKTYAFLPPRVQQALAFARTHDLAALPKGRNDIDGEDVYVNIAHYTTGERNEKIWEAHRAYIDKILKRFANPYLHDDIDRVARQPLRKLGAQERFIKPLNGMLEYDLPHDATVRAIAATLHYHNPDDPQAVEMQYYRQAHGIAATLAKYSDFDNTAVVAEIEAAYQAL